MIVFFPESSRLQSHVRFWPKQARYLQILERGEFNPFQNPGTLLRNPAGVNTDLFHRMPTWFLFLYFFISFGTCRGLWFNVTRGTQNPGRRDLFSNLDPSARCPNKQPFPDAGKTWCQARKGDCSNQGCCICECGYPSATFQMNVDPNLATCVGNSDIRSSAGKLVF